MASALRLNFSRKRKLFPALFVLLSAAAWTQDKHLPPPAPNSETSVRANSEATASGALPDSPLPPEPRAATAPSGQSNLNSKQKFRYATENAFGISSAVFAAAGAGVNQAQNLYPEFHQRAEGYGRYYWHSYADQAVDSYLVNFVLATALHTDPRYHPLRSGGAWVRMKYVGESLLLTHTDTGRRVFNTPQVLGSGMAASVSSLYYPERDRTASLVTQRWASNLAGDGLMMVLREFTPELVSAGKHVCANISLGALICKDSKPADQGWMGPDGRSAGFGK